MFLYHINIGSNIGDSRSAVERAVAALSGITELPLRRSSFVESDPWDFDSPNRFTNLAVDVFSSLSPLPFLAEIQRIEREISPASHRNPDGTYRDRLLDLDLIFALRFPSPSLPSSTSLLPSTSLPPSISLPPSTSLPPSISHFDYLLSTGDFIRLNTPELILPHPRAHLRDFVLIPLLELHPTFPLSWL